MVADLRHLTGVEYDDAVRVPGGLEPVGDEDRRSSPRDMGHRLVDAGLGHQIEVGGRLVEQQDRGIDQLCPGEGQQLALPCP